MYALRGNASISLVIPFLPFKVNEKYVFRSQRAAEHVYSSVRLQSFAKLVHGQRALYQPAVDVTSGEIVFPDSSDYGNYLDEDAWYEWQLQVGHVVLLTSFFSGVAV